MAWYLNTALTGFREAVNERYPGRDLASDGTIGDDDHQGTSSDHNPDADGSVDAWDMDTDLQCPNVTREIEHLKTVFQAHPSSGYWIHNRQTAKRSTGWRRDNYTGSNPHDQHVHWNTQSGAEGSTAPWDLNWGSMTPQDEARLLEWSRGSADRLQAILWDLDSVVTPWGTEQNKLKLRLKGMEDRIMAAMAAGGGSGGEVPPDLSELRAVIAEECHAAVIRAEQDAWNALAPAATAPSSPMERITVNDQPPAPPVAPT